MYHLASSLSRLPLGSRWAAMQIQLKREDEERRKKRTKMWTKVNVSKTDWIVTTFRLIKSDNESSSCWTFTFICKVNNVDLECLQQKIATNIVGSFENGKTMDMKRHFSIEESFFYFLLTSVLHLCSAMNELKTYLIVSTQVEMMYQ